MNRLRWLGINGLIVGMLAACGSVRQSALAPASEPLGTDRAGVPANVATLAPAILQARSRWTAVPWAELPGFEDDALFEAWNAWLKSCERPGPVFAPLCQDVRRLSIGSAEQQRDWLKLRLQPYRVESLSGSADGLLTGYFEPVLQASRFASAEFSIPLYRPPAGLVPRKPWYTRQQMETLAQAQAALAGHEIVYLANPIDALVLQIQGSGRVRIDNADGSQTWLRLAYAGSNEQPYGSVGRWLLDQGALRDASWPAIKAWARQNPQRLREMLWSNPRTIFFREEALTDRDADAGPIGAQGVSLTPGRSIAVDPLSIPFGTPVWLVSAGTQVKLQKLVLAQDTGSAITGAVRADYFAGLGAAAEELAGRLKQPLRLWVLWPK